MTDKAMIISGTVRDKSGSPIPGARVFFVRGPEALPDVAALTNEVGEFSVGAPSTGEYYLACVSDAHGSQEFAISVLTGQEQKVAIQLG